MDHKKDPVREKTVQSLENVVYGLLCLKLSSCQWLNVYKDPLPSIITHVITEIFITQSSVPPVTPEWNAGSHEILEGRDPMVPTLNPALKDTEGHHVYPCA